MRFLQNVLVRMSDGIHVAVDVYLPDGEGRYPAVLYCMPYRKDDFYPLILNGAGLPKMFAERGLAFVLCDVRGTNNSEGITRLMWDVREQRDGYELVEWIARQPWCNGNVGMTGTSYGFWTSLLTAAQNPPHLRTAVPLYGSGSSYYAFWEGGLAMAFGYHADYLSIMLTFQGSPPGFRDAPGGWRELWKERLAHYSPWGLEWFDRQADDEYWQISSCYSFADRIKIPVFVIGGWWDRYSGEAFKFCERLKGPTKILIGPWHHLRLDRAIPGPVVDYEVVFRWFEYWLKGEPNGIMDEPLVTFYVQRYAPPTEYRQFIPGWWREEKPWPIPESEIRRLHLSGQDALSLEIPGADGSKSYAYDPTAGVCSRLTGGIYGGIGMPVDQRPDEAKSVIFTTAPLEREWQVTGFPRVRLWFASTARTMGVIVKLCDVAPDGTVSLVTRGQLNVAHREGLDRPKPFDPGTIYPLEIELKATAYAFEPGHQIRLAVTSGEFQTIFSTPEGGVNKVYWGKDQASYLELPIAPTLAQPAAPPHLKTLPLPPAEPPQGATFTIGPDPHTGEWEAVRDTRTEFEGPEGMIEFWQRTTSRVHSARPAEAMVESESAFIFKYRSGEQIESRGKTHYQGHAQTVEMTASLRVTVDGKEEYAKTWAASYPRKFI